MNALTHAVSRTTRRCAFFAVLLGIAGLVRAGAEAPPGTTGKIPGALLPAIPSINFLWTGSWNYDGPLHNRGDLKLRWDQPGLTLRGQVLDKRPAPPASGQSNTIVSGGLYHGPTGSRLLYGVLDEWGLSARLRSPWRRGVPWQETRTPSFRDLKTDPTLSPERSASLALSSPRNRRLRAYGSALLEDLFSDSASTASSKTFDGGLEGALGTVLLRGEGVYRRGTLAPRKASAWFSQNPPLPERESALLGGALYLNHPLFGLAADLARSETFAFGSGLYGSAAVRVGKGKPWQVSLALDASEARFAGADGGALKDDTGFFRAAGRLELRGKKNRRLRIGTVLRASNSSDSFSIFSNFLKISVPVSYRFALKPERLIVPTLCSLTFNRDVSGETGLETEFRLLTGPVNLHLQGDLYTDLTSDDAVEKVYLAAEGAYRRGFAQGKLKAGCTLKEDKPQWETALTAEVQGKPGRLSVKLASPRFPEKWDLSLSWRLARGW